MRQQSARMARLFDRQQELITGGDRTSFVDEPRKMKRLKIVPVSIFWGHQPEREKSILKLLLSENWVTTSGFKKFLAMLFHPKHILVKFGKPIDLAEVIQSDTERSRQIRKLWRLLRVHFNQERQAIIGPDLSHRRTLIDTILTADNVRQAISKEVKEDGTDLAKVEEKALAYAQEIVSDQSYGVIRFFDTLLAWLWNRLYNGIEVNGIEQVRQIARSHELVYTPCHRSHIDYLLLSYVLYHNGLTPPHIAAGKNLNLPIIGLLLRRAGAFYMRRSFQGDALYREVFDEYLHQMFTRGFSVEYFIEGQRSRTGRTLPPRTGMLSMTVRSFVKNSSKPIALLPVYFGYERVLESSSYQSELSGKRKETESVFDIFRIFSFFKHDFGQVTVNFGEPLPLKEFLNTAIPDWIDEEKPEITKACNQLAQELVTRINSTVAIKATNLVALALLSTDRQSITETDLKSQVELLRNIASNSGFAGCSIVDDPIDELIAEAIRIIGLKRVEHAFGTMISAEPNQAIGMTYNANNIAHIYTLPSLICRYIRSRKQLSANELNRYIVKLYPYVQSEMFLPWPEDELEQLIDQITQCLAALDIIQTDTAIRAPAPESIAYSCLTQLANMTAATIERFYIVISLLQTRSELSQRELETAAAAIAAQLSALYGINSPDFFEKSLFSSFVVTLKDRGTSMQSASATLEPVISITMNPDIRH
ncbi:MAG: glycerol-3-phosphate 1-O-acyltransferase PlsB, partial [Pseudomonadales bacterium]|nr:glycerol-3-phosphate 1-O-acyltransferase PlsB [Pseudomonadales bacterium]